MYAVSVSYYARLTDRVPFVQRIVSHFQTPFFIPGRTENEKVNFFENEVER